MRSLPLLFVVVIALLSAPPLRAEEAEPVRDLAGTLTRLQDVISADLQHRIERDASHRIDRFLEATLGYAGTSMYCVQKRAEFTECRVITGVSEKL